MNTEHGPAVVMIQTLDEVNDTRRLFAAGWVAIRNGRWTHPDMPSTAGRRRLFTTAQALTLLDASDTVNDAKANA